VITYEVNESIIDPTGDYVHNEETFSTTDLLMAVQFAVARMGLQTYVRRFEWEHIMRMGDEDAVFSAWSLIPDSTWECYISVTAKRD
jgi:hypothetical protein